MCMVLFTKYLQNVRIVKIVMDVVNTEAHFTVKSPCKVYSEIWF